MRKRKTRKAEDAGDSLYPLRLGTFMGTDPTVRAHQIEDALGTREVRILARSYGDAWCYGRNVRFAGCRHHNI